jgi:transcription-repair coupling factor (superfamily II helicase)
MKLSGLLRAALADPALVRARDLAKAGRTEAAVEITAPPALRALVIAAAAADPDGGGRPVLAVTATSREADDLAEAVGCLLPADQVAVYPSWETLPHERLSPRSDTVGRRLAVLRRLAHPDATDATRGPLRVVVAPVRSVLQPQLEGLGDLAPVELTPGTGADLDDVVSRLIEIAYARVDLVTKRGEFAVRGGILDVFPPTEEHPLRVEFWGDEVEEIRTFAVADQRTLATADRLWAPPCRELLLTPDVRERARQLAEQHPELAEILDKLAEGIPVEGMESLGPALHHGGDSMQLLLDALPRGTYVVLCDPERIRTRAHDLVRTSEEFLQASWAAAATGGNAPIDLGAAAFRTLADVRATAARRGQAWWSVSPFGVDEPAPAPEPLPWEEGEEPVAVADDAIHLALAA